MNDRSEKIGVFGGSFDPPHLGHLAVATFSIVVGNLDRLLIVPCFEHALSKQLTAFEHRLSMCDRTFGHLKHAEISRIEEDLGGTSYTLRTVETIQERYQPDKIFLIIGADAVRDRKSWYRFDTIEKLCELMVFERTGFDVEFSALLPAPPEISATEIRTLVKQGKSVRGLVSDRVLKYINHHGLYTK